MKLLKNYIILSGLILLSNMMSMTIYGQVVKIILDSNHRTYQTIDNIGASSAWFTEFVGKYWADVERENMARWLFSNKMDKDGNPEGIGLSSFRFNIGGGTNELGDSSRLKDFRRRVECFLDSNGNYDWSKQSGYLWFARKAKAYGVKDLIAFSNTPPVFMTTNGIGFKMVKDYTSNLSSDKYSDYAHFLSQFVQHFDKEGLHFNYISPVNEPQWSWYNNDQEGTPWTNAEINKVVVTLDNTFISDKINSKIIVPEAGHLEYLYKNDGKAGKQLQELYGLDKINRHASVYNIVAGHSYYTDGNDLNRIAIRKNVRDSASKYGTAFWQTEYSMLGDSYKEGKSGKIPAIDCALFLAKVMHDDFVYGNAKAWQFWNSVEPGNPNFDTRYFLMALQSMDSTFKSGKVVPTKMLWALGNYGRFVRPGMKRIDAMVADGLDEIGQAQNLMVSAFENKKEIVCVVINYSNEINTIQLPLNRIKATTIDAYITNKEDNLKHKKITISTKSTSLLPRSIYTLVIKK